MKRVSIGGLEKRRPGLAHLTNQLPGSRLLRWLRPLLTMMIT